MERKHLDLEGTLSEKDQWFDHAVVRRVMVMVAVVVPTNLVGVGVENPYKVGVVVVVMGVVVEGANYVDQERTFDMAENPVFVVEMAGS